MAGQQFDQIVHNVGRGASRRGVLGVLAGVAGLGVSAVHAEQPRVGICHRHPDGTFEFIWVRGERAARKHLAHGDFLGSEAECEAQNPV